LKAPDLTVRGSHEKNGRISSSYFEAETRKNKSDDKYLISDGSNGKTHANYFLSQILKHY